MSSRQTRSSQFVEQAAALGAAGRPEEALKLLKRAIHLDPDDAALHEARGALLVQLGRGEEALKSLNRAVALDRTGTSALVRRGAMLLELGRPQEALADYERALMLQPGLAEAVSGRIRAQSRLVAPEGAVAAPLSDAAARDADALLAEGNRLMAAGQLREAALVLCNAIDLAPRRIDLYIRAGEACATGRFHTTALEIFTRALGLAPDNREALWGRAAPLAELRRFDEAAADLDRLSTLDPDNAQLRLERDYMRLSIHDWSHPPISAEALIAGLDASQPAASPFIPLALHDDPALHARLARGYAERWAAVPAAACRPAPSDRIRIGYASADFRNHATLYLMAELLEQHDRARFEVHALSFGRDDQGPWRARAAAAVKGFHDVQQASDADIAALATRLNLDIAIDLKGYTSEARTALFARRLAPVQINYLGYPGTIGAPFIDYLVADPVLIPAAERMHYSERLIVLPHSYQPNCRLDGRSGAPALTRRAAGLPEAAFVYCCFNQSYKLTPETFAQWMAVLRAVDGAVLWLWTETQVAQRNLAVAARAAGVDPARLVFAPTVPMAEHLGRIALADLFLDTFPYTAHTTASDALRVGLPVLTRAGRSFASRVAASLLTAVDLPELVTGSADAYVAQAIALGTDRERHADLRQRLAANLPTSALFDSARYTRDLEQGFAQAHRRHCDGLPPADIRVPAA